MTHNPKPGPIPRPARLGPVTVDEFAAFVSSTGYQTTAERAGYSRVWRPEGYVKAPLSWRDSMTLPWNGCRCVLHVSCADARAYCEWSGCELLTAERWMTLFEQGPLEAFPLLGITQEITATAFVRPSDDGVERWVTKGGGKLALSREEISRWSGYVRLEFSSDTVTCRVETPQRK